MYPRAALPAADVEKAPLTLQRRLVRIAVLLVIGLGIPLAIVKFAPELVFKGVGLTQGIEVGKNESFLVTTPNARLAIKFLDMQQDRVEYHWRYQANQATTEEGIAIVSLASGEPLPVSEETGLRIIKKNIWLKWFYSEPNKGWLYYDPAKVKDISLLPGDFATYTF